MATRSKVYRDDFIQNALKEILIPILYNRDVTVNTADISKLLTEHTNEIEKLQPKPYIKQGRIDTLMAGIYIQTNIDSIANLSQLNKDIILSISGYYTHRDSGNNLVYDNVYLSLNFPAGFSSNNGKISCNVLASSKAAFANIRSVNVGIKKDATDIYYVFIEFPEVTSRFDEDTELYYQLVSEEYSLTIPTSSVSSTTDIFRVNGILAGTVPYFEALENPDEVVRSHFVDWLKVLTQTEMDAEINSGTTSVRDLNFVIEDNVEDPTLPPGQQPLPTMAKLIIKYNDTIIWTENYEINKVVNKTDINLDPLYGFVFVDFFDDINYATPVTFPITMSETKVIYAEYRALQRFTCTLYDGVNIVTRTLVAENDTWSPIIPAKPDKIYELYSDATYTTRVYSPFTITANTDIYIKYVTGYSFASRNDYDDKIQTIINTYAGNLAGLKFEFMNNTSSTVLVNLFNGMTISAFPDIIEANGATDATGFAKGVTTVTSIPSKLIPDSVQIFDSAFYNCSGLNTAVPEYWNKTGVTSGLLCFYGCPNITNIADIPTQWKTS